MSTICQEIAKTIGELFTCSTVNDFIRIRTPYLYPDGDVIDVFLKEKDGQYVLTDLGETLRWLRMQTISPKRSEKQEILIQDTLLTHGVERYRGMLILRIKKEENLASAVIRLSQAAFRVSDIWFTFKTRAFESIIEEVAEFLKESKIPFEQNKKFKGRSGRSRKVDFYTQHARHNALIDVLSTGSRAAANSRADNVFTAWSDLSYLKENGNSSQFISLFDDSFDVWSSENIRLLEEVSDLAYWSRRQEFKEMLVS
ncbi:MULTISPECIES: DUF1828 domain-containing protein [unclassified Coleofasciculus]|uniref:DUF1828 domain-containing protein n=1 Tax=unclassified Coleofasciculus TaxID=2692782 RepID=UPI0018816F76|nr:MULTISPECIES: DUF1828 domain-containing protein [unclassified Coleofasciculus]MBE9126038.1 DUF1828 domain-containing protein [Coleofasciculus sp. LEGE 07081]MBE9148726.1 DUF1828 domain-containing protein [Coleofasciculus sp. LEGE 07092]